MEIFSGSHLEMEIMIKVGCLDYSVTPWEMVQTNSFKRQVSYKFNRYMSIFGSEVVSTQLKLPSSIANGWIITDVMSLHNVPFGDHFKVLGFC
jgi:VAD1 Analog of StAR-related lipid transfer domain